MMGILDFFKNRNRCKDCGGMPQDSTAEQCSGTCKNIQVTFFGLPCVRCPCGRKQRVLDDLRDADWSAEQSFGLKEIVPSWDEPHVCPHCADSLDVTGAQVARLCTVVTPPRGSAFRAEVVAPAVRCTSCGADLVVCEKGHVALSYAIFNAWNSIKK
jgi:hypothetical protein